MRLRAIPQLGLGLLIAAAGCSAWPGGDTCGDARFERELRELRAEIDAEIGAGEASSVGACAALPLGAKPCGGPWTYLVYSAEASDPARLDALAAEYDRLDAARNEACGLGSDCLFVGPPPVTLEDGRCAVGRGGAGG
jgi:hypothetical protein